MKKIIALILILMLSVSMLTSCLLNIIIDVITDPTPGYYTYTKFTDDEKQLFLTYIGEIIPFAPTDEYYVGGYYEEYGYEDGMRLNAFGNTKADFDSYRTLYYDYVLLKTETDDDGDLWYVYQKGNIVISLSYYVFAGDSVIDVFAYVNESEMTGSGVLTNEGKGLPNGTGGVYAIDFTKAKYVKNVTDQADYDGGCPTVGSPAVLVIPVEFSDITAASKGYSISNIKRAFNGKDEQTDYYSVDEYYYISSYGKLDLDITVLDEWFCPEHTSSYYKNATMNLYGEEVNIGEQMIMDEALDYLEDKMDLSEFDSDGNGKIDAVVMVNTLKVNDNSDFNWAFRHWNIYTDEQDNYYEYDGVTANDYIWMSYAFMHEKKGFFGNYTYNDKSVMNTFTFIHEFGHILGANDYYNLEEDAMSPMNGLDVMDSTPGDHNAFTKFNYGWINESRLITTDSSITLTLKPFTETGDTIIMATNWDDALGVYQEYYIVTYYTSTGLNSGKGGYFEDDCIVVYHVNASLYYEEYGVKTYYYLNNDNTSSSYEYSTAQHLIEIKRCKSPYGYSFSTGSVLPQLKDDLGNNLGYTFTIDELGENGATITFTKR